MVRANTESVAECVVTLLSVLLPKKTLDRLSWILLLYKFRVILSFLRLTNEFYTLYNVTKVALLNNSLAQRYKIKHKYPDPF